MNIENSNEREPNTVLYRDIIPGHVYIRNAQYYLCGQFYSNGGEMHRILIGLKNGNRYADPEDHLAHCDEFIDITDDVKLAVVNHSPSLGTKHDAEHKWLDRFEVRA